MRSKSLLIVLVLAGISALVLGCSLTSGLSERLGGQPSSRYVASDLPTRTPWPTFTFTPAATVTPIPTNTPLPTMTFTAVPPTNTPQPTNTPLPPTDTPEPTKAPPKPTKPPEPTQPPAPEPTPTPAWQYSPTGFEGQYNAGLAQIRGKIKGLDGKPKKGVFAQAKCGGTVIASNPSGTNLYAPGEPYEAGAYDIILSSPLSPESMCNWEVRLVAAENYEQAKDPGATAISDVAYCDLRWDEENPMTICFANWKQNW